MKTPNKKAISISLSLLLAAGTLLTACSSDKGSSSSQPDGSSSPGASATGKDNRPEITVSVYDRNNVPASEGSITDNRWTKWINDHAPVKVKFIPIPRSTSQDKFNVLFASGQAPDLIMDYSNPYMKSLASKGQIIPLDEAISKYSTTYKKILDGDETLQKLTKFNGKTYFFGREIGMGTNHYLMIRKDWLDKLNLKVPTTTEEYFQVAKAFADQDPDGNGQKDTYGTTLTDIDFFFGLGQSTNQAEKDVSVTSYFLTSDDQYLRSWDQPQAAVQFKKELYDSGAVNPDIFADKDGAKAQQDWINGKLGIYAWGGLESTMGYNTYSAFKQNNPNAQVEILTLPKSEFGQFSPAGGVPVQVTAAVNATAKNVEAVVKYVDWLVSDEVQNTLRFGIEGENYKKDSNGNPVPIDLEKNKNELNWNADYQMLSQLGRMGEAIQFSYQLDASKPVDKAYIDLINQGKEAYLSADRPTSPAVLLPVSLPDDLSVINNTAVSTIANIYTKAIVGGSKSTVDQAMKDAKNAWDKAGGKKIDDFYAKAYKDNEANVIFIKDFYKDLKK